jgi:DNA repair exonuclease SbcCD ATPase subunit
MNENINENSVNNTETNADKEMTKSLNSNLLKNEKPMDLGSMIQLASTLLKNESLINSVANLSKNKQSSTAPVTKVPEKQENTELVSLSQKLENIENGLSELNQENANLAALSQKLDNIENSLSELKQENANLAALSQKLENIENGLSELNLLITKKLKKGK